MTCPTCTVPATGTQGTRTYVRETTYRPVPSELDYTYDDAGEVESVRHRKCGTLLGGAGDLRIEPTLEE